MWMELKILHEKTKKNTNEFIVWKSTFQDSLSIARYYQWQTILSTTLRNELQNFHRKENSITPDEVHKKVSYLLLLITQIEFPEYTLCNEFFWWT